jgi:hypothetical protein
MWPFQRRHRHAEVLDAVLAADAVGGFTYHLQELANFAWFYHQPANFSAGSKFSNDGRFTTAAAPCP